MTAEPGGAGRPEPGGAGRSEPGGAGRSEPGGAGRSAGASGEVVVEREPLLLEAVIGVGTDLELRATLQHLVDAAARLTDARYGALAVVDPDRGDGPALTELFTAGLDEATKAGIGHPPCGDKGVLGVLLRDPRPLRIDDVTADPRSCGVPPGHPPMRSLIGVPVLVRDEVFGNLYLTEKRGGGPFTAEDERLIRILAAQAGIAIGNALLFENARQRERWIEGAAAVTTALLSGARSDEPLMVVAEQARLLADADAGVILQPTEEGGMEIVTASTHGDPADLVGATITPGSPVLEQLLGGEPVFVDDSATDPRMTTHVRSRFGPSMLLPLQSGGRLIGTLALPRTRGGRGYTPVERQLAAQFASQAALALVLADARRGRERLAVFEDRDRIARDLHDLVVQRLFATGMMLESTQRRAGAPEVGTEIGRAVDELESTIQEVRTAIFALQQPPADAPTSLRGKVLKEAAGAAAVLGVTPSTQFRGAVDSRVPEPVAAELLTALRHALAAAARRLEVTEIRVTVDAESQLPDGRPGLSLTVHDDGGADGTTATSQWPLAPDG
ncbi:GAF domain-containing protein [Streptomyces sp. B-S-A8]|uniref:GAF domain-containing protein n=1 Tax=Streptomyces solicavernae TaxID=3043614 RepID=A0ABT6S074_9ACTN|nr:GAF domain-containing protein [Streptomyces sp. B-S-A8]MDI3390067.1 GAF domain-containing protein [Streptomyces sp. B-S-A8]